MPPAPRVRLVASKKCLAKKKRQAMATLPGDLRPAALTVPVVGNRVLALRRRSHVTASSWF